MAGSITPYSTSTLTNHGLLIFAKGQIIGGITEWAIEESLDAKRVFEFGTKTPGGGIDMEAKRSEPYEIVPGNETSGTIRIGRYDLFGQRFEEVFDTQEWDSLGDQDAAIELVETIMQPGTAPAYRTRYLGCWFTNVGRTHSAEGDRIVRVQATAVFARKRSLRT